MQTTVQTADIMFTTTLFSNTPEDRLKLQTHTLWVPFVLE